jgi:L-asparagine transporter-like permease
MAAAILSPTRVFTFLVDASGAIALVNYLLVALSELRLRRVWQADAPERLTIRMWFYPYASWGVVAVIVAVLLAMAANPAQRSEFVSSALLIVVVLAAYAGLRRRSS